MNDKPSPFASIEEWKDFLADVQKWPHGPDREAMMREAESEIKRLLDSR